MDGKTLPPDNVEPKGPPLMLEIDTTPQTKNKKARDKRTKQTHNQDTKDTNSQDK